MQNIEKTNGIQNSWSRGFGIINNLVFAVFILMLVITPFMTKNTEFTLSTPVEYNNNWSITENIDELTFTAEHATEYSMAGKAISFFTSGCYVDAYLDGRTIYHFGEKPRFGTSPGTYQHFINIPSTVNNKGTLSIRVTASDPTKYRPQLNVIMGSSTDIAMYYLDQNNLMYLNSIFIMVFGLVLIMLFFIGLSSGKNAANLYLGLLMIDFSAWLSSKSFVAELILQDSLQQYYSSYFFSFLLPILLVNYIRLAVPDIKCTLEYSAIVTVVTGCLLLHFTNIVSLSISSRYYAFVMSATSLTLTLKMVFIELKTKKFSLLYFSRLFFMVCMITNSIIYSMGISDSESISIIQLGLIFYIIVAIYTGIHDLILSAEKAKELEVYRKYAFTDSLTGLGNRFSYNMYLKDAVLQNTGIFSLDLNNLKYYNDNFGHVVGDELIRSAAKVLKNEFPLVFRVGGDEFAVITDTTDQKVLQAMKDKLKKTLDKYNQDGGDPVLEIACGFSYYMDGDTSFEDMIRRADMKMYADKSMIKANSRIKMIKDSRL